MSGPGSRPSRSGASTSIRSSCDRPGALVWRLAVGYRRRGGRAERAALERALAKPGQINRAVRKVATLLSAILQGIGRRARGPSACPDREGGEEGGPRKTVLSIARQRIAVAYGGEESGPIGDEESDPTS